MNNFMHLYDKSWGDIAVIVIGEGYIPYAPNGGLHIVDDYGNLVKSLPQHRFDYEPRNVQWRIMWNMDIQYCIH